jgi:hypothetical protein
MTTKQERSPVDGAFEVTTFGQPGAEEIAVAVTHKGIERRVVMTDFNARRVFGSLALVLGVELPKKVWSQL